MENGTAFAEELRTNAPPEGQQLEYKAVLPPPYTLARDIAAFANTEGGRLVLGIADDRTIVGLDPDVPVQDILNMALARLQPHPAVTASLLIIGERRVYAIEVEKSSERVVFGGDRIFQRVGDRVRQIAPVLPAPNLPTDNPRLAALMERIARELADAN